PDLRHPGGERVRARVGHQRVPADHDRIAAQKRVERALLPDAAPSRQRRVEGRITQKGVLPYREVRGGGVPVLGPREGEARGANAVDSRAEREELVHEGIAQGGAQIAEHQAARRERRGGAAVLGREQQLGQTLTVRRVVLSDRAAEEAKEPGARRVGEPCDVAGAEYLLVGKDVLVAVADVL